MNWFSAVVEFLTRFWPLEVVYGSYQRGLRFWLGRYVKTLDGNGKLLGFIPTGGLYCFLPWFGHIEVVNIAPDVLKLFDQNITCRDGTGVMIAANVCWTIVDPYKSFVEVQQIENNLGDACRRHLAKRVREWTWEELVENQAELEKSMKNTMTTHVKGWGVSIGDVGLVCFVKTRNISLANL